VVPAYSVAEIVMGLIVDCTPLDASMVVVCLAIHQRIG